MDENVKQRMLKKCKLRRNRKGRQAESRARSENTYRRITPQLCPIL